MPRVRGRQLLHLLAATRVLLHDDLPVVWAHVRCGRVVADMPPLDVRKGLRSAAGWDRVRGGSRGVAGRCEDFVSRS